MAVAADGSREAADCQWSPAHPMTCDAIFCNVNTSGGVRLVRQRSDADCIYNRTWGYDRRGIWVDRGCRADFEVGNIRY
jgi:Protein of unknown function (DUF3011)